MSVLLKAALDRSAGSRSALPSLLNSSENRKSGYGADSNAGPQYLSAVGRQSTTVSASSHKSTVSVNGEYVASAQNDTVATVLQRVKFVYKYCHLNYLLPLVFVMLYMMFGAAIFLWLEKSADEALRLSTYKSYLKERGGLVKRLEEIVTDAAAANPGRRRYFVEEAIDHFHANVGFSVSNKSDWSLVTALYYSGTLFTTIGYGDVSCATAWGRIITVIYAIIGIPLMLITLNDLGKFLYKLINSLVTISKHKVAPQSSIWKNHEKKSIEVDKVERGEVTENAKPNFQLSFDATTDDDPPGDDAEDILEGKKLTPRIPVPVALGITFGWIFACAGLFKIWESDWSYAESCYFMFISLMVLCFVFVIIGLSLVSMCISVIQSALEDLYMKILMKMLIEYQNKLSQGDSHTGATMGMMQIWGGQKAAKFFIPLLSKEKRKTAMAKVQDVAEAKGLEIPKIFSEINEKSGLPNAFALSEDLQALEDEIKQVESEIDAEPKMSLASFPTPTSIVTYDSNAQTDNPYMEEKCEQTTAVTTVDANVGNETDLTEYECTGVQCERASIREESVQTFNAATRNDDTMTETVPYTQSTAQTECLGTKEQELQTHLADYLECDTQTEINLMGRWAPTVDVQTQTRKSRSSESSRMRNSFHSLTSSDRRKSASASVSNWTDPLVEVEGEGDSDESPESLDWDPRDGLHAEKQRSVRDLKRFWDVKSVDPAANPKRKNQ